jgi:branched-subunit amino acid transport protein
MPAEGPVVRWVGCVSYAMLAGLFSRMLLIPTGNLADVPLEFRLAAVALAIAGWLLFGRNVFIGACAGVGAIIGLTLFA